MKKLFSLLLCLLPMLLLSAEYGAMYIDGGSEQTGSPLFTAGTYYAVTGFTASSTSTEWSFASNTLTNTSGGGLYYVNYSLSYEGSDGIWGVRLIVNGTGYALNERRIKLNNDVGNISGGCLINIADGESVQLQVKTDTDATSFWPYYAQVALIEASEIASPSYAEMYNATSNTQTGIGTSWTGLTGYSTGDLSDWTFASNALTATATSAGTYMVLFNSSMSSSSVADFFFGLSINGATPTLVTRRHINGNSDYGNARGSGFITVANGDDITLQVKADGSNKSFTNNYSNLVLIPVSGTSAAPYASMDELGNTIGLTLSSTWQKEPNMTDDIRDSSTWTFSSTTDALTPIGDSAGKYLVSYYLGITYPDPGVTGDDIDVETGIALNGTVDDKTRIIRTLQKKDSGDFGSASGNAIITIDSSSDIVTLVLKELSGTSIGVTVKYSNISLIRLKEETSFALPVQLTSFLAHQVSRDNVELKWETATETDVFGYNVYRDIVATGYNQLKCNSQPIVAEHNQTGNSYSFVDECLEGGSEYFYWLESFSYDGISEYFGPYYVNIDNDFGSDVTPDNSMKGFFINNFPNPFNPSTTISYYLENDSRVQMKIFDLKGRIVYEKGLTSKTKGSHSFVWDAKDMSSGNYFIQMKTNYGTFTRKATLIR